MVPQSYKYKAGAAAADEHGTDLSRTQAGNVPGVSPLDQVDKEHTARLGKPPPDTAYMYR